MEARQQSSKIARRQVLRLFGWVMAGSGALSLVSGCQPAAPAPTKPAESKPAEAAKPTGPAAQPTEAAKPAQTAPAAVATKAGGQASLAIFGAPGSSLLANFTTTNFAITVSQTFFEGLLQYDDKLQLKPKLAEKWELSPDSRTWTFQLKKDLKWSDGRPVTARDVESTVLTMTHPQATTNWISYVEEIVGATDRKAGKGEGVPGFQVVDDQTFKVTTVEPSAVFLDLFGTEFSVLPKHKIEEVPPDQLLKSPFASQPNVSTGAFRLVRYTPDQQVELERNEYYWGKKPSLEKAFIKITTPETAIVQLEKGELEVIGGEISAELPPGEVERLKKNADITVTSYPNNNTEAFYANIKTMFGDKRVRQAMMYAIDRQEIVKQVLLGNGKVAYSCYPEFSPYYLPDLNKYPYDPERAKRLLQEAGWTASQQPNFILPTGDTTREQVGTIIQQYLQAVGINAQIERMDFATMVNRLTREHRFDLGLAQNRGFNNLDLTRRFHTRMYNGGVNAAGFSSPELDQTMAEARTKAKFEEQKPLTDKIQRIVNDEIPVLMIYYRDSIGAVNTKRLGGAVPRYLGVHRTMADWYLK